MPSSNAFTLRASLLNRTISCTEFFSVFLYFPNVYAARDTPSQTALPVDLASRAAIDPKPNTKRFTCFDRARSNAAPATLRTASSSHRGLSPSPTRITFFAAKALPSLRIKSVLQNLPSKLSSLAARASAPPSKRSRAITSDGHFSLKKTGATTASHFSFKKSDDLEVNCIVGQPYTSICEP